MNMICKCCLQECEKVTVNEGHYYDYGSISNAWHDESYEGSSCCGSEVVEGKIFLNKTSCHKARKDHTDENGDVFIKKGEVYNSHIIKGYYVDEDGDHNAIVEYYKKPIKKLSKIA